MNSPGTEAPIGVLLAAGRGRRMGGGKMLRRLPDPDGRPLVVAALEVLAGACRRLIVVTGADGAAVRAALAGASGASGASGGSAGLELHWEDGDPAAPMLASIRQGLRALRRMAPGAAGLVHPGDVPRTSPATVQRVLDAGRDDRRHRAVMPEYRTRGGHPVLLPPPAIDRVLELQDDHPGGLRAYWEANPSARIRVPVDDAGCRRDIDTPADLAAAGPATDAEADDRCIT